MGQENCKGRKKARRSGRGAKRTLPYSDAPAGEDSQPQLKHVSDVRTRKTQKDRPRITPVSQPNPTFGYRKTEPDMESVSQDDADDESAEPISEKPPKSAHLKAAASKRPLDKDPLVKDTHYSFVSKKPRKSKSKSKSKKKE